MIWYALFAIPNALSLNLQFFSRNDGSPGLVAVTNVISSALNIFLDWLFVFPMQMGVMGAAVATGISQTVGLLIILTHYVLKKGDRMERRLNLPQSICGNTAGDLFPRATSQVAA